MKTLKYSLSLLFILFVATIYAQSGYEIHNTTVTEKFDSDDVLQSRQIWASGVRDGEVLNMDFTVDANNALQKLIINEKEMPASMFPALKPLTDYVVKYIEEDVQNSTKESEITSAEKSSEKDKLTDDIRRRIVDLIKKELIKDELIENPEVFDFMLTYDSLYINAKKQEAAVFEKYKSLYERYTDGVMTSGTSFQITQSL